MSYEIGDVLKFLKVYHEMELEANNFLFISAYPMKNKDSKISSAQKVLRAIEEYKKLPLKIRKALENDKTTHVSKLVELERLCKEAVK